MVEGGVRGKAAGSAMKKGVCERQIRWGQSMLLRLKKQLFYESPVRPFLGQQDLQ